MNKNTKKYFFYHVFINHVKISSLINLYAKVFFYVKRRSKEKKLHVPFEN